MLEQIFSTVCISENETVEQIFWTCNFLKKYGDFSLVLKAFSEDSFNNNKPEF